MHDDVPHGVDGDFVRQMQDWRPLTADILYHMPDHPHVLQSFTWQTLDMAPRFPRLIRFLDFWSHSIDGMLHSVRIMHGASIRPAEYRFVDHELRLN
ncbi:usg protein [Sphingosinicella sp.]|jgi:uncharacterized protein Usg|uniref:usg protein n=1 Tax=Sphingosinicella sp. TaxID=1917971 RepID=UPI001A5BD12B|nr:protein usg [Sphingosinicella sp.]